MSREMPKCRWRTLSLSPGRYGCASPKLIVGHAGVGIEECSRCYCRDHEPGAAADRPLIDLKVMDPAGRKHCRHLGAIIEYCHKCASEWKHVRDCAIHDRCTLGFVSDAVKSCGTCADYSVEWPKMPPKADPKVKADSPSVAQRAGVVIGCYGWPKLARVQVRTVREMCGGDTPILIADDGSPAMGDMARMCESEGVEFAGSLVRSGHYSGDRDAMRKGVVWGEDRGFDVVVKLSQRMLITTHGWLDKATSQLVGGPAETLVRSMVSGSDKMLYFRTEAVAMRVADWSKPEVLSRLEGGPLGNPTELLFNDIIQRNFQGRHIQWELFAPDRYAKSPGTLWHCTDSHGSYVEWAARYGLELDADFYTAGHNQVPGWKRG